MRVRLLSLRRPRADHRPTELSAGEQQRVALARAIVGQPQIVWADEPTANLDTEAARDMLRLLDGLHSEGVTIVLVTHDVGFGAWATRRIRLEGGRVVADERR